MATEEIIFDETKALAQIVERLSSNSYNNLEELCQKATLLADRLEKQEIQSQVTQYTSFCISVLREVQTFVDDRKNRFVPYINSLSDKVENNHDCSSCSGGCKFNHDVHLLELAATAKQMKELLNRLQMATLPLYIDAIYPDSYRLLRGFMSLLETNLSELLFLENTHLIPKVKEAQTKINVGSK